MLSGRVRVAEKGKAATRVQDPGDQKENPKEEESPRKEVTKEVVKETEPKERGLQLQHGADYEDVQGASASRVGTICHDAIW